MLARKHNPARRRALRAPQRTLAPACHGRLSARQNTTPASTANCPSVALIGCTPPRQRPARGCHARLQGTQNPNARIGDALRSPIGDTSRAQISASSGKVNQASTHDGHEFFSTRVSRKELRNSSRINKSSKIGRHAFTLVRSSFSRGLLSARSPGRGGVA